MSIEQLSHLNWSRCGDTAVGLDECGRPRATAELFGDDSALVDDGECLHRIGPGWHEPAAA